MQDSDDVSKADSQNISYNRLEKFKLKYTVTEKGKLFAEDHYRWIILAITVIVQVSFSLPLQSIPPLAPLLRDDLSLSLAQIGLLGTAMYIGTALVLVPSGWIVDLIGARLTMFFGQIVVGFFFILFAFMWSWWSVLAMLFFAGLGLSFSGPTTAKAIVSWFSMRSRATAMGIKQAGVQVSGMMTALALPPLGLTLGWRPAIIIVGGMVIFIAIISLFIYRDNANISHKKINVQVGWRALQKIPSTRRIIMSGSWESFTKIMHNPNVVKLSIGATFMAAAQFALTTYLVIHLTSQNGLPIVTAGVFLAIAQLGGGVGRIIWGIVSDRVFKGQRRKVLAIVAFSSAVLVLILAFAGTGMPLFTLGILIFFLGFTTIGWPALHLAMIAELAGLENAGASVGLSLIFVYIGMMSGPPIFGAIIDTTASYTIGWMFVVIMAILGLFMVISVREKPLAK